VSQAKRLGRENQKRAKKAQKVHVSLRKKKDPGERGKDAAQERTMALTRLVYRDEYTPSEGRMGGKSIKERKL